MTMSPKRTDLSGEAPGFRSFFRRPGVKGIGDWCRAAAAVLQRRGGGIFSFWTPKEPREVNLSEQQPGDHAETLPDTTPAPEAREALEKVGGTVKFFKLFEISVSSETMPTSPKGTAIALLITSAALVAPPVVLGAVVYVAGAPVWAWMSAGVVGLGLAIWLYRSLNRRR
jgi:hypothetical protein